MRIKQRSQDLGDWRAETLAHMRALIMEADPEMIEERKSKKASNAMAGVPVRSHNGIVCSLVKAAVAQNGPPTSPTKTGRKAKAGA